MRNKAKVCMNLFIALLVVSSCQLRSPEKDGVWVADVRSAIQKETPVSMKEDVEGIEYIPLETTDSCLISNVTALIMDDEFIFVQNGKTDQNFLFTRQGKFVREVGKVGEGPGEYPPYTVLDPALDTKKREIYLNRYRLPAMVYSYDGEFLRTDTTITEFVSNRYLLDNGCWALAGAALSPIQQSPWLAALKDKNNRIIATKVPFPANLSADVCYMQDIQFVPFQNSALVFTLCNDTLFRVTEEGITPACIYDRKNGAGYYEKIANINEFAKDNTNTSSTIDLFTFFETSRYFYFRASLLSDPKQWFFQRLNKETGEFVSQPIAPDFIDISRGFSDANVLGPENDLDGGVPFCPRYVYKDRVRVQVINAETIANLEEKGYLKNKSAALQLDSDDNPVVIVYSFKN